MDISYHTNIQPGLSTILDSFLASVDGLILWEAHSSQLFTHTHMQDVVPFLLFSFPSYQMWKDETRGDLRFDNDNSLMNGERSRHTTWHNLFLSRLFKFNREKLIFALTHRFVMILMTPLSYRYLKWKLQRMMIIIQSHVIRASSYFDLI